MAGPPQGPQLQPVAVVARVIDLSERQVHDLARRGTIPRKERGRYDLFAVIRAYIRHLREIAAGRSSRDGELDIVAERARVAREQADGLAMKNAVMRRELIPAHDVEASRIAVHSAVVMKLRAVPRACARLVARENEPRACEEIIRRHLEAALAELANTEIVVSHRSRARAPDDRKDHTH